MIITKITQQKNNSSRVSVFLDDSYSFSLSKDTLLDLGLAANQEVSESDLVRFLLVADKSKAYNKAVQFISRRPYGEKELLERLQKYDLNKESIEAAISRLKDLGLLDDREFVRTFVRYRKSLKPKGKRMIGLELLKKGISKEIIDEELSLIDDESEVSEAVVLLEKKFKEVDNEARDKVFRYLAGRGYDYDIIKKATELVSKKQKDSSLRRAFGCLRSDNFYDNRKSDRPS